jgi:hypothetical protein
MWSFVCEDYPIHSHYYFTLSFLQINIALSELEVVARPSRCTYSLAQWLQERHRDVYPQMEGYVRMNRNKKIV